MKHTLDPIETKNILRTPSKISLAGSFGDGSHKELVAEVLLLEGSVQFVVKHKNEIFSSNPLITKAIDDYNKLP